MKGFEYSDNIEQYWGYIARMENKIETTIMGGYLGYITLNPKPLNPKP